MSEYDSIFKVIVVGDTGVGKTSILSRLCDGIFESNYRSTLGIDFKIKNIIIDEKKIKLQIWDTAGQERFAAIVNAYYRGTNCAVVVFDLTDSDTLSRAKTYIDQIRKFTTKSISNTDYTIDDKIPIILLGNKVDIKKRDIQDSDIRSFMELNEIIHYIETSAKDDINVLESFNLVANILYNDELQKKIEKQNCIKSLELSKEKSKRSNCC
jgi:Ras-related protein Rab-1A